MKMRRIVGWKSEKGIGIVDNEDSGTPQERKRWEIQTWRRKRKRL
jgi:hypothetical protein